MTLASFIAWFTGAFVFGVVIMLGCVGETLTEKSGNLNLGVPGIMYLGGISSLSAVFLTQLRVREMIAEAAAVFVEAGNRAQEWVPDTALLKFLTQPVTSAITVKGAEASYRVFFDFNGWIGVVIAIVAALIGAALGGLIYSFLTVTLRANQNVTGLTLTIFGSGVANFFGGSLNKLAGGVGQISVSTTSSAFRTSIPWISTAFGKVSELLFNYGFFAYIAILIAVVTHIYLNKTRRGLNLRAVGENPATADAAGIDVTKYKYLATCIGAAISGLGGLYFVMDYIKGTWANDGSIESLGWLAVALVIFTKWKPVNAIWGAFVFGMCYWIYLYMPQAVSIFLADLFNVQKITHLQNLYKMIPYLVTIVVLIITSLRKKRENQPPQSLGLSYFREDR